MTLKVSQKFLVAVAVPVVFELVLVGSLFFLLAQADTARHKEAQAKELASQAYKLVGMHVQRLTELMVYKSTQDPLMFARAQTTADRMQSESRRIHEIIQDSQEGNESWKKLDELVHTIGSEHKQALDRLKAGDKTGFTMIYAPMQQHFEQLLSLCDSLTTQQTKNEGLDVDKYGEMIRLVLCLSIAVSLMLAAFLAYIFNHGTADRLKVILDNTRRMAAGKAPDKKLGGDDELAEIDNMYHDMHESLTILRRRERAILENVADVVCSIDSNMRFTDINDAAQKHWGYKNDDLVGSRPAEIVAPEDREMVSQALNAAIEAGQEARFECRVLRQDGTTADTEWSVTWSAEESSLYCIVHDISARKHLDRMKRDFVAMISHEIRTPLTAIQLTHSFLLMEMEEALDEMSVQSLNEAQDNVNRLMAMVNNLLDLDKLESGCVEFVAESTEARALIEKSINAIDSLFRQKSITVSANIDPAITFYADKDRIVQVMINLLANAIKYSPSKSEITVKARTQGNFVRVEISDQGRGIPPDKLQTIFERFRQVEAADAREHKGIGLGLAISKAIVERHKGQMGVESVPGRGSTFWFTIPASEKVYLEV